MPKTLQRKLPTLRLGKTKPPYLKLPIDMDLYDMIVGLEGYCEDCLNDTFQTILRQGLVELLDGTRFLKDTHHH